MITLQIKESPEISKFKENVQKDLEIISNALSCAGYRASSSTIYKAWTMYSKKHGVEWIEVEDIIDWRPAIVEKIMQFLEPCGFEE